MEGLLAGSSLNAPGRVNDSKLRMATRPMPLPPTSSQRNNSRRTGAAFEDFGSDFSKKKSSSKPAKPKARVRAETPDSGSSDELNSLPSRSSRAGSEANDRVEKKNGYTDGNGIRHIFHPSYKSDNSSVLKGLKFKKNKAPPQGDDANMIDLTPSPPSALKEHDQATVGNPIPLPPPQRPQPKPPRGRSPVRSNFKAKKSPSLSRRRRNESSTPSTRDKHDSTPPQPDRPQPRPLNRKASPAQRAPQAFPGLSPTNTPSSSARRMSFSGTPTRPRYDTSPSRFSDNDTPGKQLPAKRKAVPHPSLSLIRTPAKFPSLDLSGSPETAKKAPGKASGNRSAPKKSAKNKSTSSKKSSAETRIKKSRSSTRKTVVTSCEESSDEEDDAPRAQPFPMSTQVFEGIGSSLDFGPSSLKRSSSGNYEEPDAKRMKEDPFDFSMTVDVECEDVQEVDPSTLCPYCDAPLPAQPTTQLMNLLASAAKRSRREPRPGNRLGRTADFTVYISVCRRHQFENQMLPEAERRGWPKTIDWTELSKRVRKMRGFLRAIIEDDITMDSGDSTGPKARCTFWREALEEVKQKGTRAVAGVRGQFASFEKIQPGYYGEMGSVIIHQTLYDLFPPTTIESSCVSPLTASEFLQRILVPEIGARLIMQDMDLLETQMDEAVRVLRESANYGVAMFPADDGNGGEDGGEDEEMGAADLMLMQTAMKRRKELDADEREEVEDLERQMAEAAEMQKKSKSKKHKGKEPGRSPSRTSRRLRKNSSTTNDDNMGITRSENDEMDAEVPRPRRLPSQSDNMHQVAETETITKDSRPKPRPLRATMLRSAKTDTEDDHPPSSQTSRPKPRPITSQRSISVEDATSQRSTAHFQEPPSTGGDTNICSSSEDTSDDRNWNTGRMKHGRKKRTARDKGKVRDGMVLDSPPLAPPSSRTPRGSVSRSRTLPTQSEEDTPRPRAKAPAISCVVPESPQLLRARAKTKPTTSHGKESHSWLLSDSSRSSIESNQT